MARQMRTPRFPTVTKGDFGRVNLVFRAPVAPGETLKRLKSMYAIQSAPFDKPLAGAWFDMAFYYVPCRLLDATFIPSMMAGTYVATRLNFTDATMNRRFFAPNGGPNTMVVRAYEAVINRYYRDLEVQGPFALTAGSTTMASAVIADRTAESIGIITADKPDESIALSGTSPNQTVSVQAMWEAEQKLRTKVARENMDATYSGYLEAFGVSRDDGEGFLVEPEVLTSTRKWVMPSKAVDESTGETVQSYFISGEHDFGGRKYFSEHGYIIGVATLRPKWFYAGKTGQIDDAFPAFWQDAMTVYPLEGDPDKSVTSTNWISSEAFEIDMRNVLYRGEQLVGPGVDDIVADTNETFVASKNPATLADTLVATGLNFVSGSKLGASFQLDATHRLEIATPISRPARF